MGIQSARRDVAFNLLHRPPLRSGACGHPGQDVVSGTATVQHRTMSHGDTLPTRTGDPRRAVSRTGGLGHPPLARPVARRASVGSLSTHLRGLDARGQCDGFGMERAPITSEGAAGPRGRHEDLIGHGGPVSLAELSADACTAPAVPASNTD